MKEIMDTVTFQNWLFLDNCFCRVQWLTDICMGRSHVNAHLFKIGVPYLPTCSCGLGDEDTIHYFCYLSII